MPTVQRARSSWFTFVFLLVQVRDSREQAMDGAKRLLEQLHAASAMLDTAELTTKEIEREAAGRRVAGKREGLSEVPASTSRASSALNTKFKDLHEGDTCFVAGRSALASGSYSQAEKHLRKAESMFLKHQDAHRLLEVCVAVMLPVRSSLRRLVCRCIPRCVCAWQCYTCIAECMEKQERYAVAAVCRDRQLELALETDSMLGQALANQGLGFVCFKQGRYRYERCCILRVVSTRTQRAVSG